VNKVLDQSKLMRIMYTRRLFVSSRAHDKRIGVRRDF